MRSANFSRNKGKRVEFLVRDYFRALGMKADRVPLSGASEFIGKGDVRVEVPGGGRLIIEVKARKSEFDKIYAFIDQVGTPYSFAPDLTSAVYVSYSVLDLPTQDHAYSVVVPTKDHKRIMKLKKYLGKADILIIKADRRPLLFIRFA